MNVNREHIFVGNFPVDMLTLQFRRSSWDFIERCLQGPACIILEEFVVTVSIIKLRLAYEAKRWLSEEF